MQSIVLYLSAKPTPNVLLLTFYLLLPQNHVRSFEASTRAEKGCAGGDGVVYWWQYDKNREMSG